MQFNPKILFGFLQMSQYFQWCSYHCKRTHIYMLTREWTNGALNFEKKSEIKFKFQNLKEIQDVDIVVS